ncbi:primosome assembly protein PriA, partial [Streptomyces sp. NPDC002530]
ALRRWIAAAALVRGRPEGGTVVVVAEPTLRPVQALVRWDPVGHARRELADRAELGFPPVSRMASVAGAPEAVAAFLAAAALPPDAQVLGPVPVPAAEAGRPRRPFEAPAGQSWERILIRVPPGSGAALAAALKKARVSRTGGGAGAVRIRVDPPDIG